MKPLKVEAGKLYDPSKFTQRRTAVTNRGCLRNGQKDFKGKRGKQVAAIAIDEVQSITE